MNSDSTVLNDVSSSKDGSQTDIRNYLYRTLRQVSVSPTRMVDDNNEGDRGELPPRRGSSYTMEQFAEKCPEAYSDLAKEVEEMGGIFMDYVGGKVIKGAWRYLSDVILYRNSRELHECLQILRNYGRTRRNGMFGFSVEDDHIHVIHDCAFAGNHCRDVWRKQIEPFGELRPTRIENKPIWKFTRTDWLNVFEYFFLKKRGTREIWVRGESWKAPSDGNMILYFVNF